VIQAADIYDALTTERPYKAAYSPERALETLRNEAAAGWRDPQVIEAFEDVFPLVRSIDAQSSASLLALSLVLGEAAHTAIESGTTVP
jgi:HD-GYP domain-containing protein (c-di-GMP phosphodiesterase class II)